MSDFHECHMCGVRAHSRCLGCQLLLCYEHSSFRGCSTCLTKEYDGYRREEQDRIKDHRAWVAKFQHLDLDALYELVSRTTQTELRLTKTITSQKRTGPPWNRRTINVDKHFHLAVDAVKVQEIKNGIGPLTSVTSHQYLTLLPDTLDVCTIQFSPWEVPLHACTFEGEVKNGEVVLKPDPNPRDSLIEAAARNHLRPQP